MRALHTDRAPAAIGPYSQAVAAGPFLFTAGQIGLVPETGQLATADVVGQAEQVFRNLAAVLTEAGLDFGDVVKSTVFLTDMTEFPAVNEVYARHFTMPYPARSTAAVAALPADARVEIEVVARSSKPSRGANSVPGGFDSHTLPPLRTDCRHLARGVVVRRVRGRRSGTRSAGHGGRAAGSADGQVRRGGAVRRASDIRCAGGAAGESDGRLSPLARDSWLGAGCSGAADPVEAAERAGNESLVETRKDQREDWLVLAVFWGLLSGVDAWVSAHMWDFEGAIVPPPDGSPGVAVQYSVPVGGP